jgi:polyferredoxin/formate hydrogenlyase subunit 6/NADH:ubiquinone oxidoreductase subunit I
MRITKTRAIVQAFFLGLFVFLAFVTTDTRLKGYPVSWFLELDPLVAVSTALSARSLYRGLIWSLVIVLGTLVLGRFFCGWICPFGTLHHVVGWLFGGRTPQQRIDGNRYRRANALKYYLLIGLVVAAALGSLQIGLLDPIVTLYRSFTTAVWPAADQATGLVFPQPPAFRLSWFVGFLLLLFLSLNLAWPRFFCRVLCPLGALMGVLSRFSLWRIERDLVKCTDCDLCLKACEGAADPHTHLRKAECYVCMNCLDDCQYDAIGFKFLPAVAHEVTDPDLKRRHIVLAALSGLFFVPLSRAGGELTTRLDKSLIRPPGSLAEPEFLARCTKCEQCLRVCPTNVLQPAIFEAGLEGFWTPVLDNRTGYCELNCVLCGQVCEAGAIERISLERKLGLGEYQGRPIRIGTAFFDHGRCLPWSMDTPCVVCEEVCPTSPKAIFTRPVTVVGRKGETIALRQPYVQPDLCIGCGICEHECPVKDLAAVRVTAIGETRAADRVLLLETQG